MLLVVMAALYWVRSIPAIQARSGIDAQMEQCAQQVGLKSIDWEPLFGGSKDEPDAFLFGKSLRGSDPAKLATVECFVERFNEVPIRKKSWSLSPHPTLRIYYGDYDHNMPEVEYLVPEQPGGKSNDDE